MGEGRQRGYLQLRRQGCGRKRVAGTYLRIGQGPYVELDLELDGLDEVARGDRLAQ